MDGRRPTRRAAATRGLAAALGLGLALAAGCSGEERPPMARVWGKVVYKGEPLTRGEVVFSPDLSTSASSGQLAVGEIGTDGSYQLGTFDKGDGAVLGSHIVTVKSMVSFTQAKPANSEAIKKKQEDGTWAYVGLKSLIPKKYTIPGTSPLRYTVKADGPNEFNIEIAD